MILDTAEEVHSGPSFIEGGRSRMYVAGRYVI